MEVPALERDEIQSGGVGIAAEDSPADESVCTGSWRSSYNTFRPADYETTGILLDVPVLPANSCCIYSWTSYSKDYDSSASDYDHYVVANWSSDGFPDPGFRVLRQGEN